MSHPKSEIRNPKSRFCYLPAMQLEPILDRADSLSRQLYTLATKLAERE